MNFSALDTVPSKQAIAAYKASHPEQHQYVHKYGEYAELKRSDIDLRSTLYWIMFGAGAILLLAALAYFISGALYNSEELRTALTLVILGVILVTMGLAFISLGNFQEQQIWRVATQLDQFAKDNQFQHIRDQIIQPQGIVWSQNGIPHLKTNAIVTPRYEIATVVVHRADGDSDWAQSYIRIPLATHLPNMVISSTSYPILAKGEKIELEGDFNKYFSVYATKEQEVTVRYFLTPDIMAALIDTCKGYHIEIIDDNFILYLVVNWPANWFDRSLWDRADKIYESIGRKLQESAEQYKGTAISQPHIENMPVVMTSDGQASNHLVRKISFVDHLLRITIWICLAYTAYAVISKFIGF